ncbi:hypothetical protein ACFSL4_36120, partial [Streptomyces caeni]
MSQQGERPTGHEDDWWGQLYDDSAGDTGAAPAADSLDDRFASAAGTVGSGVTGDGPEAPSTVPGQRAAGPRPGTPADAASPPSGRPPAPLAGEDPRRLGGPAQRPAAWDPPAGRPPDPSTFPPGRTPPGFRAEPPHDATPGGPPPLPGRPPTDALPTSGAAGADGAAPGAPPPVG